MSEHESCPECETGPRVYCKYSIVVLEDNDFAKDLLKWYESVFLKQHPDCKDDFDFEETRQEGKDLLEICAHNELFSVDALICLFIADKTAFGARATASKLTVVPSN